jgi:hypothetical protein
MTVGQMEPRAERKGLDRQCGWSGHALNDFKTPTILVAQHVVRGAGLVHNSKNRRSTSSIDERLCGNGRSKANLKVRQTRGESTTLEDIAG